MLSSADVLEMQKEQFRHDRRNHSDILSLHKNERLKHYGLHFSKYVGRLARGPDEEKSVKRTVVDTVLVSLSAANTLHQRLGAVARYNSNANTQIDILRPIADAAGRFADACEKIDHLEEFVTIAKEANLDIFYWALSCSVELKIDVGLELAQRRIELSDRQFYVTDL
ncbi:hypothetical protein [Methylobacterium sp. 10]|uniref:hypothetical protein n=1 Tax=Methylobacterium sp. 10 TaxID=1101191 RepID=UPI0012DD0C66|nr:hypothetical protein [Methylobacterium sp. 10]